MVGKGGILVGKKINAASKLLLLTSIQAELVSHHHDCPDLEAAEQLLLIFHSHPARSSGPGPQALVPTDLSAPKG